MAEESREEIKFSGKMITVPLGQRGEGEIRMATEAQETCIAAGMQLFREHDSMKKATRIIFPINVRGIVKADDLKIPHSELAIHVGAAGNDILAFALTGKNSGLVAYDDGQGGCAFTSGLDTELFSPGLRELVKDHWEKRGPD